MSLREQEDIKTLKQQQQKLRLDMTILQTESIRLKREMRNLGADISQMTSELKELELQLAANHKLKEDIVKNKFFKESEVKRIESLMRKERVNPRILLQELMNIKQELNKLKLDEQENLMALRIKTKKRQNLEYELAQLERKFKKYEMDLIYTENAFVKARKKLNILR